MAQISQNFIVVLKKTNQIFIQLFSIVLISTLFISNPQLTVLALDNEMAKEQIEKIEKSKSEETKTEESKVEVKQEANKAAESPKPKALKLFSEKIVESKGIKTIFTPDTEIKAGDGSEVKETDLTVKEISTSEIDAPEKENIKLVVKAGVEGKHVEFSKPVKIEVPVSNLEEGKEVTIKVQHEGSSIWTTDALSQISDSICTNGVSNNQNNISIVEDSKITFYTCGASTFSITPSAGTAVILTPPSGSTINPNTTFTGTGSTNGAVINLTIPPSTTVVGTAIVKNGQWSITPSSPLPLGANTVCIGAATSCGNFTVSAASVLEALSCGKVYGTTFVSGGTTGATQVVQYDPVSDTKVTLPFSLSVAFGKTRAAALSPNGTIITYYDDADTRFESYNTVTGVTTNGPATAMAGIPNTAFNRLGYNSIGEIYSLVTIAAAPSSTYLIKVDPVTLAATNSGILTDKVGNSISVSALGGGDLIFDNADKGYLIDNSGYFFKIDISTRVATFLATAPATTPAGLAYGPGGLIYTFTSAAPNGNIYAIDLAANSITLMETQTGTVFADAFGCAYPDIAPKPTAGKTPAIVTGAAANGTGGTVSTTPATILSPGDLVEYSVVLRNGGITAGTNSKYQDTLPSGTTYIAGSTKMNTVAVTDGAGSTFPYTVAKLVNSPGAAAGVVSADLTPAITTDKEVTITYRVRISDPFTATPRQVSNQGTFTSDDFVTIQTDNPNTTTPGDATITPINTPPVAVDDNYTTTPGTAVTLTPLTGDTDVNTTQTLKVTKIGTTTLTPGTAQVITVANGIVNVSATGVITFTPTAGFTGLATIPYTISDGAGGTATANEKITVSTPPTATNDNYTTTSTTTVTLTPLTGDTAGTIIKSINGVNLTPGTAQTITITGKGVVKITAAGVITFKANMGVVGDTIIPYVIQDTAGNTATANEIINIPNIAPIAVDDKYYFDVTTEGTTPMTIQPLSGDYDPNDRGNFTAVSVLSVNGLTLTPGTAQTIPVTNGTVTTTATGQINFLPNVGYSGNVTFPYVIQDSQGLTATANETIIVGQCGFESIGFSDRLTYEGGSDPDQDQYTNYLPLKYITTPSATVPPESVFTSSTTVPAGSLTDYTLGSGPLIGATWGYMTTTTSGKTVQIFQNLLSFDSFVSIDGGPLQVSDVLVISPNAQVTTYYSIQVPKTCSTTTATDDNYTTTGTAPVTLTPLTGDTAGTTIKSINGVNLTPGTAQSIPVTNGTVTIDAAGVIKFTPTAGFTGDATIPYVITDTAGNTATANEKITVSAAANLAPTATDDYYYFDTGDINKNINPKTGDKDPEQSAANPILTYVSINGQPFTPGIAQTFTVTNGTVTSSTSGALKFTPTAGYEGTITFPYVIKDPAGNTATANQIIQVAKCGFGYSQFSRIDKASNAITDPDDDRYSFGFAYNYISSNSATPPALSAFAGSPTLTPITNYVGAQAPFNIANGSWWLHYTLTSSGKTFEIYQKVTTGASITFPTSINLERPLVSVDGGTLRLADELITSDLYSSYDWSISYPNICPTAIDDNYTTTGTTPVTLTPLTGDTAGTTIKSINGVDLTPGTAQVITTTNGTVNVSSAGVITFTPTAGFTGDATFPYVIQDTAGNTATANEKITVSAAPAILNIKANKTADKINTFIGDNIIYTLDFENIGTADASGATIKDTLPEAVNVNSISCVATGGAVCPLPTPTAAQLSSGVVVNTFPAGSKLTYTVNTTVTGNEAPAFVNWTSTGNNTATGTLNGVPMTLTRTILTPSCMVSGNTVIYGTQTEAQQLAKSGFSPTYYTPQPTATTNWLDVGVDQNYCPANNGNQTKVTLNFSQPVKDPTIHILNLDAGQMVFDAPFTATKVSGNSYFEVAGNVFNSVTNGATITGCGTGSNGTQAGCGSALASGYYNSISFFLNDTTPVPGNGDGFQMTISTIPVATTVQNCAEATVASGQTDSDTTNNNKCVSVTIAPPFVNSPPVAVNDSYTTPIGTPKVLTPLTGDTDPDAGQTLTVTKIGTTVLTPGIAQTITFPEGVVTTSTTGVITFTPNPTFTGVATIPYTISDGNGGTAVANEVIAIIKAVDDLKTTPAGVPVTYNPLTNDSVPVGSIISKINGVTPVVGTPISVPGGTVTLNADGTITVIPTPGSTTPITFPYEVTTPDGTKTTATDTITVIKAVDDVKTIVTGTPTIYDPKANDVNIPAGSTITSINGTPVVIGTPIPVTGGTVTVNADGTITVTPTPGSNAPVTFPYEITTPDGTKVTANDTLNQVNAVDDTKTTPAGVPVTYNPLTNDNVPTGSTITKINGVNPVVGTPIPVPGGTVTLNADGTITVSPTPGSTTPIVFPYEVTTPDGTKTTATDTITVTNQPPVAVDDNYTTTVGVPVVLTPLTADTDQDGNVLTVTKIGTTVITPGTAQTIPVTNGTVTISATGVIVFTPAPGFVGTATIPYTISDGNGGTATANELVNIPQIATIELDKAATYNDTNGNASGDVGETITYKFTVKNTGNVPLTNVTISDPTVTIIGGPIATLAVGATDTTTFTATHVVTAADISAGFFINTATASGTPPVGPTVTDISNDPNTPAANDPTKTLIPPFAFPDLKGTAINTPVTYNPLANDILPSGSTLKLINGVVATPGTTIPVTNGSVKINNDGTITVTPDNGFTGTITFPYVVQTIAGDYNSVDTVNVYKAVDETKTTPAGTPVTYSPMSNDVVPSGSTITKIGTTPVVVGTPITIPNGTVTVNADGSVTVTPNPGYTGTLTFPYEVTTPDGVKVTANDTVNVVSAVNDTKTTAAGSPITYNPLTNDALTPGTTITAINGTPITVITPGTLIPVTGGTVTVNLDGTITVTPTPGSTAPIRFVYEVTTPDGTKVIATDTITVIKAVDDNKTTIAGQPVTYNPLTNDVNIPVGSIVSQINGAAPVVGIPITIPNGTVTLNGDGTITVSPDAGYTGPLSFPYQVTTPDGVKVTATNNIEVIKANDDTKSTPAGSPISYNPLDNDSVPAGSTITKINGVTPVVGTPIPVTGGTVTLNTDGTITVIPTPGSLTPISFPYEVTTPDGTKTTAAETINQAKATDDTKTTPAGIPVTYNPLTNDILPSGSKITTINGTTVVIGSPIIVPNGTVVVNLDGTVTVTPNPMFAGIVTFPYQAKTTDGLIVSATDTITVIKAVDDTKTTPSGTPITYNPLTNDNLPTGSTITKINGVTPVVGTPIPVTGGTVTLNSDGTITVTPTPGSLTPISFPYEVTTLDGTKTTAIETITPELQIADLSILKLGDKVKTANGDTLTYTIKIKNNSGTISVPNATIVDALLAGYSVNTINCTTSAPSICPTAITSAQLNTGLVIPNIAANGEITITIVGTVTTIDQLVNRSEVKLPAGFVDPNLENNVSEFPTVFDPPSGKKIGIYLGSDIVEWKQVWINEKGKAPTNATIVDNIPAGTTYVPNTLQCFARGSSITVKCEYNTANDSTSWQGTIGADFDHFTEETANNEIVITFQIVLPANLDSVENQSEACNDRGCSKSDNPGTGQKGDITKVTRPKGLDALIRTGGQALSQNPELIIATGMLILGGVFVSLLLNNKKKQY
jgi:Bacterial Ig domain/Domain of unknown function DUF11/Cadherin-like domain